MSNFLKISLLAAAIALLLYGIHRNLRRGQRRFVGTRTPFPKAGQSLYTLSESSREILKCRYFANSRLRAQGKYAADLVNERMIALQGNETDYRSLAERARHNGWTVYEALYQETVQQLLREDIIDFAPDGACQDDLDGGISVGQVPVS